MGSGHILVYAFDVLMQIYEAQGYTQRDAAQLIVEKNLYGLDMDETIRDTYEKRVEHEILRVLNGWGG